nr:immunoglobulin heavy chain junction region [Mus musculus]
CARSGGGFAYW